jgi:hypothetical protein
MNYKTPLTAYEFYNYHQINSHEFAKMHVKRLLKLQLTFNY